MLKKLVLSFLVIFTLVTIIPFTLHAEEYKVQPGDSLWRIAQDFELSVTELYELNKLDSSRVFPGQVLQVKEEEIIHQIEQGDTLYALAIEYEVTVLDLMNWNNLETDLIITGDELTIYPNAEAVDADMSGESNDSTPVTSQPESSQTTDTNEQASQPSNQKTMTMTATAYTAECEGCTGITYTGLNLNEDRNKKVIAVDPDVIPLGTRVHVEGYGEAVAGDIGSAIKGNKIDIHVPTKDEAFSWGVREVAVTILE